MPAIKLDVTRECILPKNLDDKKTPKAPNLTPGMAPGMGAVNLGSEMMPDMNFTSGLEDDMPEF